MSQAESRSRGLFGPLVAAIEGSKLVDAPAAVVSRGVRAALSPGKVKDALSGTWLGHPLHPALTDLVVGSFLSATLLDLLPGEATEAASRRLILVGMVAYGPTALAGASDWTDSLADERVKRVGIVHAAGNVIALALYGGSLRSRRRGQRGRACALTVAGASVAGCGAYLGGHLTLRRGVGVDQTIFTSGSEEWRPAADASALPDGQPVRVLAGETPVLLLRRGERIDAIHDRCSHRGCSLAEGEIEGDEIVCGCHFSRFDLRDGALVRGPATAPQPAYEVREQAGQVEVRLASAG